MAQCRCLICEQGFESKRSDAKYCSHNCALEGRKLNYQKNLEHRRILGRANAKRYLERNGDEVNRKRRQRRKRIYYTRNCIYCGESFMTKRSDKKSCGKRDKLHRPNDKPKTSTVICAHCGQEFERRNSDINRAERNGNKFYCSRECMGANYQNRETLVCSQCGKTFERAASGCLNGDHNFCSKECQKENIEYILRGEDHWRYINGDTSCRRGIGWIRIRKEIRKRDHYSCQECGITEREIGKALDVHHVIPYRYFDNDEYANDPDNLMSLCPSCHHSLDALLAKAA